MNHYNNAPACVYGRVSTGDQQNSLDLQLTQIKAYAAFKRLALSDDRSFYEDDTSGRIPVAERDGGAKLLAILREGKVKHLVIPKLDRFGRRAVDIMSTLDMITKELGVTVHILDLGGDSFSTDSPISRFIIGVLALCAELEVERTRARIQEVLDNKIANNERVGQVPFGWRTVKTGKFKTDKAGVTKELLLLEPDPAEQVWLRRILQWRACGNSEHPYPWGYGRIAAKLNELGVPSKRAGEDVGRKRPASGWWNKSSVKGLLKNRHVKKLMEELNETQSRHDSAGGQPAMCGAENQRVEGSSATVGQEASNNQEPTDRPSGELLAEAAAAVD
jgi:DNA invertase Pin-like site-specific DNA recombinase